ncbi:MAG: DUF3108 domain-containing protein [Nitrospirae bacterium]|nr:DUF3108 domain-containing protein [Nitrospirota bacterium]MBI3352569.1 DUF3108 domain-containing protein [Nitrospirota bacterium]
MLRKTNLTAILSFLSLFVFLNHISQYPAFSSINPNEKKDTRAIQSGERLEFSINWMGINAGKAILEVGKTIEVGSSKAFHITSTATSNNFISRFFPVEDRIETFMDVDNLVPLKFKAHQREGRRTKDREVIYDQVNHKVSQVEEGKEETFDIAPGAQDALSALYFFRTLAFPLPGESAFIKVYEGGKNWDLEIKVLEKETIDTPIGSFNTIKTIIMARFEGVFLNKGDITVWFTDDHRHVPVQMKSKVVIGSVTALLVSKEDEVE